MRVAFGITAVDHRARGGNELSKSFAPCHVAGSFTQTLGELEPLAPTVFASRELDGPRIRGRANYAMAVTKNTTRNCAGRDRMVRETKAMATDLDPTAQM
jgi:hypothetical protein